jgi:hypothetical protein
MPPSLNRTVPPRPSNPASRSLAAPESSAADGDAGSVKVKEPRPESKRVPPRSS